MAAFEVRGGQKLHGEIIPQGAKNEALQILCAVLLSPEPITISNVPNIRDVNKLIELLRDMGVKVGQLAPDTYMFQAEAVRLDYLDTPEFVAQARELRGSVMILGPLLARYGKAQLPKPGGDKIGRRPLDTHFVGLEKLGAELTLEGTDFYRMHVPGGKLRGASMLLDEASVTGTANILMGAVLAEGTTTIYNAACEPYLQQLCRMLVRMGANIQGIGSNLLIIEGVESLGGTEHRMLPDMIEIGSFIGLAAMTAPKSPLRIARFQSWGLSPIPSVSWVLSWNTGAMIFTFRPRTTTRWARIWTALF
jgi:UDP-N-acetylglucosamine 1-carboxyvinyltransferase